MKQSYIFDFCSLFDMEQAKDIEHYQKQRTTTNNKGYESNGNITGGANV